MTKTLAALALALAASLLIGCTEGSPTVIIEEPIRGADGLEVYEAFEVIDSGGQPGMEVHGLSNDGEPVSFEGGMCGCLDEVCVYEYIRENFGCGVCIFEHCADGDKAGGCLPCR